MPFVHAVAMAEDPLTLVVSLDSNGCAHGDVYLDDGHSYAFRRGEFAHHDLVFKDGVLSSLVPASGAAGSLRSDVVVERIIVLGLPGGLAGWQVSLGSQRLEAEPGPILMEPGLPDTGLVVRKPGVKAAEEWSITFKSAK
jgi:alpha 1,3-glucosidase